MLSRQADPWTVCPAVVREVQLETPGVMTYSIELTDAGMRDAYAAKPGQFNMLYLPGVGEAAISLSRLAVAGQPLTHTVRSVGNVTRELAAGGVGYPIGVRGPFGTCWPVDKAVGKELILVAGGIGLAPLRPVIHEVMEHRDRFERVILLMGARTPADLLYKNEYDLWRSHDIDVQTTVDRAGREWTGHVGVVTLMLDRVGIADPKRTVMFSCGPEVMMTYAIASVRRRGVPRGHLWLSLERNMNCAIGHCGHCQFGPHFICKDGPVLRYDQVNDLMRVDSL
ncbi:Anaerobic sulfite reductase subunit B [Rubripirellula reticaptiva]|uniref:Anaerobic sulfite reductase subunit B n=2 Tax=Rubripirellula reticaptiva TaxID=2528013 RepID=A0A5C6ECQ8_9BACT|nr:Anaerobic sulfite reductase subunit B [Rubripirellula reticaptiva]